VAEQKKKESIQQYMGFWKDVYLKAMERNNKDVCADIADNAVDRIRQKFE